MRFSSVQKCVNLLCFRFGLLKMSLFQQFEKEISKNISITVVSIVENVCIFVETYFVPVRVCSSKCVRMCMLCVRFFIHVVCIRFVCVCVPCVRFVYVRLINLCFAYTYIRHTYCVYMYMRFKSLCMFCSYKNVHS